MNSWVDEDLLDNKYDICECRCDRRSESRTLDAGQSENLLAFISTRGLTSVASYDALTQAIHENR